MKEAQGKKMFLVGKVSSAYDKATRYIRKIKMNFAVKSGYHNKYGQLIGVDKINGIAVFGDRINTSTRYIARIASFDKEGNKLKYIWTDGYAKNKKGEEEIELRIDNFKTGLSTVISSKTKKAKGKIRRRSVKSEDKMLGVNVFGEAFRTLIISKSDKIWCKIKYFTDKNKVVKTEKIPQGKKISKGFFDQYYNSRKTLQKKS